MVVTTASAVAMDRVSAARHLCQEARTVLTSLRGGPPHVARGDLAQDLMDLRERIPMELNPEVVANNNNNNNNRAITAAAAAAAAAAGMEDATGDSIPSATESTGSTPTTSAAATTMTEDHHHHHHQQQQQQLHEQHHHHQQQQHHHHDMDDSTITSPYARPFLQVVMDPRAAGPHTLVALRAIHRLLQAGSFQQYAVPLQDITKAVLACKFEQTDPGADEAVEMAIADVICLLVQLNAAAELQQKDKTITTTTTTTTTPNEQQQQHHHPKPMSSELLMDAFNTVFITRNTFVHSPALCYHFEDVLTSMVMAVWELQDTATTTKNGRGRRGCSTTTTTARLVLEFLVNQLLHTPLVGGDGLDESTREAQLAHDATRVLCLRLVRTAIQVGWSNKNNDNQEMTTTTTTASPDNDNDDDNNDDDDERTILHIIQDDLCLSLLMTGQAIWAYHDAHTNISPGFVTTEVLAEICATISLLWNTLSLRQHLMAQFETIFTGFYTRALVLLRKRKQPVDSISFNANLIFDAEVEIILESLVDILCLHDHANSIADNGDGGSLESIFAHYDCHMRRSDVAMGLMVELCRCCGGSVDAEGDAETLSRSSSGIFGGSLTTPSATPASVGTSMHNMNEQQQPGGGGGGGGTSAEASDNSLDQEGPVELQEEPQRWRQVPAHLKELCAQAIMGGMRCLFLDDHASEERVLERSKRKKSILLRQVSTLDPATDMMRAPHEGSATGHFLRDLKSKKRLMRKAAGIFNKKSSRGIAFLVDSGLVPDPVTPASVADFLRSGIVVGLDKKAVGQYLGEAGKSPVAGKSPPNWERDWFHKEVLQVFCSLFRFENQSLLDGLRMFLASFRLPGEAQQIDRILQAFADSCGQVCEESSAGCLKLFSDDPKRSSDAAYLLSFSIIMLNTDQHNNNIREDRKMSVDDFVKNNTDYGRDITDKGKELPREYLEGIYRSIREEEIRTEGEGADGAMTVERWKDVMRCAAEDSSRSGFRPSQHDVEDLTELVLEHTWKPIVSAIGALWGATFSRYTEAREPTKPYESAHSSMSGVQGARLGMDMAIELMNGVRLLGRIDVFRKIFACVCDYTGLLGEYTSDGVERTWALTNSLECQSAVFVAFQIIAEAGEDLDEDCWRLVWSIIFELRDLKLINKGKTESIFYESDADLLSEEARRDWNMCLVKGDMELDLSNIRSKSKGSGVGSVLGAFGRALFGSDEYMHPRDHRDHYVKEERPRSAHGKEELVVWDECAPSDDELDAEDAPASWEYTALRSPGAQFERQLIRESVDMSRQVDMPVTGLERAEETRRYQISPRARVRHRFRNGCRIETLVNDSRFMGETAIRDLLKSLVSLISQHLSNGAFRVEPTPRMPEQGDALERNTSETSSTNSSFIAVHWQLPLSPASEALGEVLLCEIALKNKDRLKELWSEVLQDHYMSSLASILVNPSEENVSSKIPADPGLEKRVTGLIRLSIYGMQRADLANEILSTWKYVLPMNPGQLATSPLRALHKQMGEGLWRIVARVDDLLHLNADGWEGLISLFNWCAMQGSCLKPILTHTPRHGSPLPEDDVAIQCYRALHLILNTPELESKVPSSVAESLRILVSAGERRNYYQLSIATLDLLALLLEKKISNISDMSPADQNSFWKSCWRKMIEAIAEATEKSSDPSVRQHSLSMLTDLFLDKQCGLVPTQYLVAVLSEVCVPLAGKCITRLKMGTGTVTSADELLIEFELCIGLIFKPLRHHLKHALGSSSQGTLSTVWKAVLIVLEELLTDRQLENEQDEDHHMRRGIPDNLRATMNSLANEHFQNVIMVLISAGVLFSDSKSPGDITSMTWEAAKRMGISESAMQEWRQLAEQTPGD